MKRDSSRLPRRPAACASLALVLTFGLAGAACGSSSTAVTGDSGVTGNEAGDGRAPSDGGTTQRDAAPSPAEGGRDATARKDSATPEDAAETGTDDSGAQDDAAPDAETLDSGDAGPSPAVAVAAGEEQSCAVTADGNAWCWSGTAARVQVPTLTGNVKAVSAGGGPLFAQNPVAFACAVTTAGGVWCWGDNSQGELGNGTTTNSTVPTPVSGLSSGVIAVSAGPDYSACAVTGDGNVWCWGSNGADVLGDAGSSLVPVKLSGFTGAVSAVSVGYVSACAIVAGGGVECWGTNTDGQLGNGSKATSLAPVQVTGITSGATAIAVGTTYACAVVSGGVQCWGNNGFGASSVPAPVTGLASGATAVSIGAAGGVTNDTTCAIVSGGVQCWGDNTYGELGDNSTTNSAVPVAASVLTSGVTALSVGPLPPCGGDCAIKSGGSVWCWGAHLGALPLRVPGFPQ